MAILVSCGSLPKPITKGPMTPPKSILVSFAFAVPRTTRTTPIITRINIFGLKPEVFLQECRIS